MSNLNEGLLLTVKLDHRGIPKRDSLQVVFQAADEFGNPADGSVSGIQLVRSKDEKPAKGLYFCSRVNEFSSTIFDDNFFFLDFTQFNLDGIIDGTIPQIGQGPIQIKDPAFGTIFVLIHKGVPYTSNTNIVFGHGKNKNTLFISNTANAYAARRPISPISAIDSITDADYTPNIAVHAHN